MSKGDSTASLPKHVRVQLTSSLELSQPRATFRAEAGLVQDLDRHLSIQHCVMGAVDHPHSAPAKLLAELVAVVEYCCFLDFTHRVDGSGVTEP